jgi:hypothetical protein
MIPNKKSLMFLCFLCLLILRGQEVKIMINGLNIESIKVGDSILKKNIDDEFLYYRKECEKDINLTVYNQEFTIPTLQKEIKFIVIDYNSNAAKGCYVINQAIGDVMSSWNINNVPNCSNITSVGLFDKFDKNKPLPIRTRIRKN